MNSQFTSDERVVILKIQNAKKPDQVIYLVLDKGTESFETEGLKDLFGSKEIRIRSENMLQSLPDYAEVLSFLLETLSEAQDLRLPYHFQREFSFGDVKYTIHEEGDYRVLERLESENSRG